MAAFLYAHGAVYILENARAQRVKVGMTAIGASSVVDRLRDVNDKWLERKVTCQICGTRLVNVGGHLPDHVLCGKICAGGNAPPLEQDVAIAELHLKRLKWQISSLSGSEKGSVTRMIKTLETRIDRHRLYNRGAGEWEFRVAYDTEGVAEVEKLSHKILAEHLDRLAPFGEVFCCSVSRAMEAVESALIQLGVQESARKKSKL
jgi:hypothetical protein